MLFCHTKVAIFKYENIRYMAIYIPRNFIATVKHVHVVVAEATECLENI